MSQLVLEGTWEEVAQHAAALSGKQVRLTVIESAQTEPSPVEERPLAEALKGLIGVIDSRLPYTPRNRPKCDAFGEGVIEKLRKQGLTLPEERHDTD